MTSAPVLAVVAAAVFAAMILLHNPTEAGSLVLFPVGVVLAVAALVAGIHGTLRGGAAERTASAFGAAAGVVMLALAGLAVAWLLWFLGVFGNAWG